MKSRLRILLLEDDTSDAELVCDALEEVHFACATTRVQTRAGFLAALHDGYFDLILADYKLPSFDGFAALKLARAVRPDLPFIIVSGTLGEELAIEALKTGATDYVLKTRLSRLVPAVQRAIREAKERAERKTAEEALRRSDLYLAEAQRLSHTGSFGWDISSGEIVWSDETFRIFGCEPRTKPTIDLVIERIHPDDRTHVRQIFDRASADRSGFIAECRLVMPDASVRYVQVVANLVSSDDPNGARFIGAVTDITERKRAEEMLREQANLLDLTHDAIFAHDMSGVITYWNRGAEALYGWAEKEARGRVASELLKTEVPVPFELKGGCWQGELVRTTKDGTQVVVASRWSLRRSAQGAPVAVLETNNDITRRKHAEEERERLRQLEADLARTNRVSMMGELAASLAHEIKQPIAAAVMHANACVRWLQRDPPEIAKACNAASALVAATTRAVDIIDRVRSLYKRDTPERELVDLNDIVREMTVVLEDTANRNSVSIRTELDPGLPTTTADRVQLQQVLVNLMLNGIEAMQGVGGELTVASKRVEHDQVLISVQDSGVGFPGDADKRIFEAFFTTKPQGTGMGLSISRRIIESHGGRLWASANAGQGATFQFTLPGEMTEALPRAPVASPHAV